MQSGEEIGYIYENLGLLYENGISFFLILEYSEYNIAYDYYIKASRLESCGSFNNIGVLYHNGTGFTKDLKKAREWYEKSIM